MSLHVPNLNPMCIETKLWCFQELQRVVGSGAFLAIEMHAVTVFAPWW